MNKLTTPATLEGYRQAIPWLADLAGVSVVSLTIWGTASSDIDVRFQ